MLFFLFAVNISTCAWCQVTDMNIIESSLGKKYPTFHKALDSLGVWYTLHVDNDQDKSSRGVIDRKRMYSIADGKGTVKVWAIILDAKGVIEEIVINVQHHSRQQLEDARRFANYTDFHVGLYSTDYVFKRKK